MAPSPMDPVRWQQIERLYHEALTRPAAERAVFLEKACPGDEAMRLEVQALLDTPVTAERFLAAPAVAMGVVDRGETVALTGRRLGVYRIHERIGAGGMGERSEERRGGKEGR